MLAGAACAALAVLCAPVSAATSPELPGATYDASADQAVGAFYAARRGAPLWLRSTNSAAAGALLGILERAPPDGLESGPAIAGQARSLISRAQAGDATASAEAERLLSAAWMRYVEALQTPPAGMTYADQWVAPRRDTAASILAKAAAAPSLASYVQRVAQVNPLYAQLRDAAWISMQSSVGSLDPRILAS